MPIKRREFLLKGARAFGAASSLSVLPAVIRRALAVAPNQETGTLEDVKHIVILMQENRSFDHYFGSLRGVRGFGDRFPIPLASGKPVWFQSNGSVEVPPYHLDSTISDALLIPDNPHNISDAQAAWNQGKFGEWPRYKTDVSMGHYRRADIPFQFALAEAFTICDAYHCSLMACTDPNRILFMSGSNYDPALRQQGINCTKDDAEVTNGRCIVSGAMPAPGYAFNGSAFKWPTLPELLQDAGISWRIYQDPNDNWDGLMHGGLAFESFRKATSESGSALYENGMKHWSLDDLRSDVLQGTLPSVSWILPSMLQSEHPAARSSPGRAGDFTAQVLDALTASPDSWSQTALFVTFDENDGFFDHVPAPALPSYNIDGSLAGNSTGALDGEYFADDAGQFRLASDTTGGSLRPYGLGARVPMYVVSPWSRGGWVNSQVFDHSSMSLFLEKRFGINVESVSPWRRAVCGDLTSAFDFTKSNVRPLTNLPDVSNFAAIEAVQRSLPAAKPPASPAPLFQESGIRHSRALPYELHTSASATPDGTLQLVFSNSGTQGAVFHVYDQLHLDRIPRRYTVEAGKKLSDAWSVSSNDGEYHLWVYGPNGFLRTFKGNADQQVSASYKPEIQVCYEPVGKRLYVKVHNTGRAAGSVTVAANAYRSDGPWMIEVAGHAVGTLDWDISSNGQWYDFTAACAFGERRFAGRMETGEHGISDPEMAASIST